MKVLNDIVLIKQQKQERIGSILTVDNAVLNNVGTVYDCGPGLYNKLGELIPLEVQPGNEVVFDLKDAVELQFNQQKYLVVHEKNIYCVLND